MLRRLKGQLMLCRARVDGDPAGGALNLPLLQRVRLLQQAMRTVMSFCSPSCTSCSQPSRAGIQSEPPPSSCVSWSTTAGRLKRDNGVRAGDTLFPLHMWDVSAYPVHLVRMH
jgi:hypothetical protein